APKKSEFFSMMISGAERLPNGNTLICSGANGTIFEVTPDKQMVWKYVNPAKGGMGPGPGGFGPPKGKGGFGPPGGPGGFGPPGGPGGFGPPGFGGPPQGFQILPPFVRDQLELTDKQAKQLETVQEETGARLDKMLSAEQKKQLREIQPGFGRGGP